VFGTEIVVCHVELVVFVRKTNEEKSSASADAGGNSEIGIGFNLLVDGYGVGGLESACVGRKGDFGAARLSTEFGLSHARVALSQGVQIMYRKLRVNPTSSWSLYLLSDYEEYSLPAVIELNPWLHSPEVTAMWMTGRITDCKISIYRWTFEDAESRRDSTAT
jgi:hypothetical protein